MYICNINWPKNNKEVMEQLLSFMITVVDSLNISFPPGINNPLETAKMFMNGEIPVEEYESARDLCWKYIDERNAIREFGERDILYARLGLSLLSANKDPEDAGEKLAWFFEVLDYLKIDTNDAEKLMANHFSFGA